VKLDLKIHLRQNLAISLKPWVEIIRAFVVDLKHTEGGVFPAELHLHSQKKKGGGDIDHAHVG
jgi:hypothetical protein